MKMLRLTLLLALCLALAGQLTRQWVMATLNQPVALPIEGAQLIVKPGDHLESVLRRLESRYQLSHPTILRWYAKWRQLDRGLQAGEYRLVPPLTGIDILEKLNRGDVVEYSVTLPEGITLADALRRIQRAPGISSILSGPDDSRLLALVAPYRTAEGLFLPETYRYTRADSDLDILRRSRRLMERVLKNAWANRESSLPLATPYDAVILASIIERETAVVSERAAISGVFMRRLQRGMRLQTDPTVIYGLGDSYQGNLTRAHLRDETNPWNTYRHHGLPPTPIALPGAAAIEAALQPAEGDALYFVARGDGYHAFSATIEEHNRNVRRFQLSSKNSYRSTPADGP